MLFGPNRPMREMQPQSFFRNGPSQMMQQPFNNNPFTMFNMPNRHMSNVPIPGMPAIQNPNMMPPMQNPMMRQGPSGFMGSAGRGFNRGGGGFNRGGNGSGGGGLLSKLFGRSGARNAANMGGVGQLGNMGGLNQLATRGGLSQLTNAGGIGQLLNPNNLTGMLGNVQKALKMAEGVMPMVQQYGPLVRNVPAMLKLYNELKNTEDTDENSEENQTSEETVDNNSPSKEEEKMKRKQKKVRVHMKKTETNEEVMEKASPTPAPKLYI